jgi:isocitrate lyase
MLIIHIVETWNRSSKMRPNPTPIRAPDGSGGSGQDPQRFAGIRRGYTPEDVIRLSGSFRIRHSLAEIGAARLWHLLKTQPFVPTLGALTGNRAVQQVKRQRTAPIGLGGSRPD